MTKNGICKIQTEDKTERLPRLVTGRSSWRALPTCVTRARPTTRRSRSWSTTSRCCAASAAPRLTTRETSASPRARCRSHPRRSYAPRWAKGFIFLYRVPLDAFVTADIGYCDYLWTWTNNSHKAITATNTTVLNWHMEPVGGLSLLQYGEWKAS